MTTIELSDEERAFQRVLRMLNASEQSSQKVRRKLEHAGYEEVTIERALDRARCCGILDDRRYAEMLVRSALSQNKGFRSVSIELEELGISLEEVSTYQEHQRRGDEDPLATDVMRAREVLRAHPPRAKNVRNAAFRKLLAKGYDTDVACEVARWWSENHGR